jgi:hypothetical protein
VITDFTSASLQFVLNSTGEALTKGSNPKRVAAAELVISKLLKVMVFYKIFKNI